MVLETPALAVFMDVRPEAPGHVLVVPRLRRAHLTDLPADVCQALFETARRVARAQVEALGAQGVRLEQRNGRAAGQSVFHVHLHVIPCWQRGAPSEASLERLAARLGDAMNSRSTDGPDTTPP